jgi:hypothetical protein
VFRFSNRREEKAKDSELNLNKIYQAFKSDFQSFVNLNLNPHSRLEILVLELFALHFLSSYFEFLSSPVIRTIEHEMGKACSTNGQTRARNIEGKSPLGTFPCTCRISFKSFSLYSGDAALEYQS